MFTLSSKAIQDFFKTIGSLKISNSSIPILECVLIKVLNGTITFTVSDLQTEVSHQIGKTDCENLQFCVEAKKIKELSKAPGYYVFTLEGSTVKINNYKLPIEDAEEFPLSYLNTNYSQVFLKQFECDLSVLSELANFVGKDDLRLAMTGIYFNGSKLCATDAWRMRCVLLNCDSKANFVLAANTAKIVAKLGIVTVFTSTETVVFLNDTYRVKSRKIDAQFPDYNSICPKSSNVGIELNRKEFLAKLKNCLPIVNKSTYQVVLSISEQLTLIAKNSQWKTSLIETIPIKNQIGFLEIAFDCAFLIDIFSVLSGDTVFLQMSTANKPLLIRENGSKFLLMPVTIKD